MKTLKLVAFNTNTTQPKRILVLNSKDERIADVFCDTETEFSTVPVNIDAIKQIVTIAENFNLFWHNLNR
jgi:hypothetical protein